MRKIFLSALIVTILLLFASCSTSVSLSYYSPSEIDMGRYRNIAVASCVPFEGFHMPDYYVRATDPYSARVGRLSSSVRESIKNDVASYMTDSFISSLRATGFFTVIGPSVTDRLVSYSRHGMDISSYIEEYDIDAFIVPKIVSMDVDEYLSSERTYVYDYTRHDDEGRPIRRAHYDYYLTQTATLVFQYTVIDARTMAVYAVKNFSDKNEKTEEVTSLAFSTPSVMALFSQMSDHMSRICAYQLAPHRVTLSMNLMKNDPELETVESAYELTKGGYIEHACEIFRTAWKDERHLASGYNYALLSAALGKTDEALAVLEDMRSSHVSAECDMLYEDLLKIKQKSDEAALQFSGQGSENLHLIDGDNVFSLVIGDYL